jgi:serine/threonine-protein kinase
VLFVAMDLLPGVYLRTRLAVVGRLPVDVAHAHVLGVCDALREAHAMGVVLRDIKPSNLFLVTRAGEPEIIKLLDFGVAKRLLRASIGSEDFTASGAVVGSLCYMAPEQLSAAATLDARADVWSLAVVLFECLAGNPPYQGRTLGEYAAVLAGVRSPPPLRAFRLDVPAALDEALGRALAIDPDLRTPSIDALARELADVLP